MLVPVSFWNSGAEQIILNGVTLTLGLLLHLIRCPPSSLCVIFVGVARLHTHKTFLRLETQRSTAGLTGGRRVYVCPATEPLCWYCC